VFLSLILRSRKCAEAASCAFAYLVFSSALGYWEAFIAHNTDPKFQSTPLIPIEVGLTISGIVAVISGLSFWGGTSVSGVSRALPRSRQRLIWAVVIGAVGSLGERALYSFIGTSGAFAPVAWVWIISFPLIAGYVVDRSRKWECSNKENSRPSRKLSFGTPCLND